MELTRILRKGMSGDDVKAVKEKLFALGFYTTNIKQLTNNTLGIDSVAAIKRYQIKNGLQVDGIVGQETWGSLFGRETVPDVPNSGMSPVLEKMRDLCETEVDNGSVYVWASGGELGINVDAAWIKKKENRCDGGANYLRAYGMWKARKDSGNTVFRCFDCSGFVSWILTKAGVFSGRRDCDGLWSLSNKIDEPVNGALLFRQSSSNSNDETHVGLYFDGYAYHAKGRDVGVVKERYSSKFWHKCAYFKALPKE